MKALKFILIGIGTLILSFVLFGFVLFMSQPNPPAENHKISSSETWNINTEFHQIQSEFWEKDDNEGKLFFNNQSLQKQKATLYSGELPSEHKKKGYITTSITVPSNFDALPDDAIFGIQIGEKNADEKNHLVMGVNGKGEVVVVDGNLEALNSEKVKVRNRLKGNCCEEMTLSFHYYQNPYGWIVFFTAQNESGQSGATINHIPFQKLDGESKELSLVAFNPSQNGKIWFKDWKIQNDWTPND